MRQLFNRGYTLRTRKSSKYLRGILVLAVFFLLLGAFKFSGFQPVTGYSILGSGNNSNQNDSHRNNSVKIIQGENNLLKHLENGWTLLKEQNHDKYLLGRDSFAFVRT